MAIHLLLIATLVVATVYVRHNNLLTYYDLLKPLTTISIIALPLLHLLNGCDNGTYTILIIVALLFCLGGDMFLLRDKWFVYGLASFLVGHILFVVASVFLVGFKVNLILAGVMALIGIGYFAYLNGNELGNYKVPVAVYVFVIAAMIIQYTSVGFAMSQPLFLQLAFASVLFGFSDSVIAYTKFVRPLVIGEILILTTYWMSITIFAMSPGVNL